MAHACGVRGDDTLVCLGSRPLWSGHAASRHLCGCQCRCTPHLRSAERRHAWPAGATTPTDRPHRRRAGSRPSMPAACTPVRWKRTAASAAGATTPMDRPRPLCRAITRPSVRATPTPVRYGRTAAWIAGATMRMDGPCHRVGLSPLFRLAAGTTAACGRMVRSLVGVTVTTANARHRPEPSRPSAPRDRYTCGLRTDSTLACWGQSHSGRGSPPSGTFTHVSAGGLHACAVQTDGVAACWGDDAYGQATPPGGRYARARRPMSEFDCAQQADGRVVCGEGTWFDATAAPAGTFRRRQGRNLPRVRIAHRRYRHLLGVEDARVPPAGAAANGAGVRPPFYVSVGGRNYCALRTDGTIFCWGASRGLGSRPPAGIFTALSAADHHACGLRTDGSIACWGGDWNRQATPPGGSYLAVSTGALHTCAVRTDQTLICWGDLGLPLPAG